MAIVVVNFSLDDRRDKDILAWLDSQPPRSRSIAIRAAIRAYGSQESGLTLADIMAEIRALPSKMPTVVAIDGDGDTPDGDADEPEAAASNLDGLLGRLGDFD